MKLPQKFRFVLKGIACFLSIWLFLGFYNAAPLHALSDFNSNELSYTANTDTLLAQSYSTPCLASADWVNKPNPPSEIPGNPKTQTFCQFYQFSWQWFLYLMSPSASDPSLRNFQDAKNYPILQVTGDSCSSNATEPVFFIRTVKDLKDAGEFVLPERINQAGDAATIYAQNDNVVFYSIRFGRDLCTASNQGNLPTDTTEIKMAWKTIEEAEKANYISIDADVIPETGTPVKETLGLVGYHLVRGTPEHPELIWSSYEHKSNAPNCLKPSAAPANGWSFLSESCSQCLSSPNQSCFDSCKYNAAQKATSLTTDTPSEICRIFPEGTAPGDNKGEENITDVDTLNQQLVGPGGILTSLPANNPMAVMANYFNIGALWVNDTSQPANPDNQRGGLRLENPTMETTYQGTLTFNGSMIEASTQNGLNCFSCHIYTPNKTATSKLSHIFDNIHGQ
ncbi:MAG: hypothetical protein F6J89_26295 [Symploca sp. SIO1C4]|uniref:Uncharacterized protein n=1 Tax=Symploca sp. SIO1C4 TaxID=2607765 RepID=A0A6B3NH90_9CYAN|nr:hypothetical protein [Symploca sp. SIO1C4]